MRSGIKKAADAAEFATDERCFIVELGNDEGDRDLSVARARVESGVTTAWHRLDGIDERYLIVEGSGRVEIGDDPAADVGPGDLVRIPAGRAQRITNIGDGDLVFYALCTPRFRQVSYHNLE